MSIVRISMADDVLVRFGNQLTAVGAGGAQAAMRRASAHTGAKARTQVARALVKQTGLRYGVMRRAIKLLPGDGLGITLQSKGGNVSLKYFKARETRVGVTAAPWNRRTTYAGTFIKSGWVWSKRRAVPKLGGHVFKRVGDPRLKIKKQKSGLFIPKEMLEGASVAAFKTVVATDLMPRLSHELGRLLSGASSAGALRTRSPRR